MASLSVGGVWVVAGCVLAFVLCGPTLAWVARHAGQRLSFIADQT